MSSPYDYAGAKDSAASFQKALLFYCTMGTDVLGGSTVAVARYVNFAQITCFLQILLSICSAKSPSSFDRSP